MSDAEFDIEIGKGIFDELKKLRSEIGTLRGDIEKTEKSNATTWGSMRNSLKNISFVNITQGIENMTQGLRNAAEPGLKYNASLQDLSALTGISGAALQKLGDKARASAKEFGGDAAASINSYKVILGRLGPDIAKNGEALSAMERNVQILSKTMGNDSAGAVDALTTAMLQFGVDLSDPKKAADEMAKMMDVMANSAQQGAAEVPAISEALKVSGVSLKQANVSFIEANAAIQALAQGGKEGAEAGTALRNVLGKMAGEDIIPKEAAAKLKLLGVDMNIVSNTALPFTDRLRELKKAEGDATIMAQVFGVENANAAKILLQSVDAQDELATKIGKVGGAQAQANIVMDSTEEKMKRFKASVDDMKISLFEATDGTIAYLGPLGDMMRDISSFGPLMNVAKSGIDKLRSSTKLQATAAKAAQVAQKLWSLAMEDNPIGLIIAGAVAAGAAIYGLAKAFDTSTAAEKVNAEVKERVAESTADQRVELDLLFDRLKSAKKGTEEYKRTLSELNDKYPDIIEKYNLQEGSISNINRAYDELINKMTIQAELEANKDILKELAKERLSIIKDGKSILNYAVEGLGGESAYTSRLKEIEQESKQIKKNMSSLYQDEQNLGKPSTFSRLFNQMGKPSDQTKTKKEEDKVADSPVVPGLGIAPPKAPAATTPTSTGAVAGGEQMRNISVKIDRLVENLVIKTTTVKEGVAEVRRQVSEAMVAAVRDFEVAI